MSSTKFPKEKPHIGWIVMEAVVMFPKDELLSVDKVVFEGDDPNDKRCLVRVNKATPTIEFVCADVEDAERLYNWLNNSKKVVNIQDFRK